MFRSCGNWKSFFTLSTPPVAFTDEVFTSAKGTFTASGTVGAMAPGHTALGQSRL
jgi:hypothetical protein